VLLRQAQELLVVGARRAGAGGVVRVAVEDDRGAAPVVCSDRVEVGQELPLGAQRQEVTRLFVRYGLGLAAIGIACGLAAAIALTRLMGSLLFEVSPIDPLTYVGVCLSLTAAAMLASFVPALRATMVNPVTALRAE